MTFDIAWEQQPFLSYFSVSFLIQISIKLPLIIPKCYVSDT